MPGWGNFLPRNSQNGSGGSGSGNGTGTGNAHGATSESGGSASTGTGNASGSDATGSLPGIAQLFAGPPPSADTRLSPFDPQDQFEPHSRTSTVQHVSSAPHGDARSHAGGTRTAQAASSSRAPGLYAPPSYEADIQNRAYDAAMQHGGPASGSRSHRPVSGLPSDPASSHSPSHPSSAAGLPSGSHHPSLYNPHMGTEHPYWAYRMPSYASSSSTTSNSQTNSSARPDLSIPEPRQPETPHEWLQAFLVTDGGASRHVFSSAARKRTIQHVYRTLLQDADWHRFLLPVGGTDRMPKPADDKGWVWRDEYGVEQLFSLSALQKTMDLELVKGGRDPVRKQREGKLCGKTLKRYERTYTCKTCAKDLSCIICVDCFNAADHEGHEVLFGQSFSFSASCDCGDPSAWQAGRNIGCAHHPPLPPGVTAESRPSTHISDEVIPRTLISALYRTIEILLDFISTTLQWAPLPSDYASLPPTMEMMRRPEPVTGVPRGFRGSGPWSVVVWADEKHTAKEFTRQIRDATGVEWEVAEQYAKDIEERGRLIILTTTDPIVAFHAASVLQQIDIVAFLRPARDAYQEELAATCISILSDLSKCHVGGDPEVILRLMDKAFNEPRGNMGLEEGTGVPADLLHLAMHYSPRLDWFLLEDVRLWRKPKWEMRELYCGLYSLDWEAQRALAVRFTIHYQRLFEIYLFHDRDADSGLLFCIAYMVLGNGRASAYATETTDLFGIVLNVAHAWFTGQVENDKLIIPPKDVDRSSNSPSSLMRPSAIPAFKGKKGIALFGQLRSLLQHEEIQRMLANDPKMLRRAAQFLNVFVGMQTQVKELDNHVEFEVDWPRTFVYLGDLSKSAREIGESLRYVGATISDPLTGIVTRNTAPVAKMKYVKTMIELAMRVYRDICLDSNILDKSLYPRMGYNNHRNVLIPGSTVRTLSIDTAYMAAFSFHSYLDLLFAEGLKHVDVLGWRSESVVDADGTVKDVAVCDAPVYSASGEETLEVTYQQFIEEVILDGTHEETKDLSKLILMEIPLQKHAVLSHIRADLWRKNGSCMRGQAHHYRDATVRDATLDQEFFALQAALCSMPPLQFFTAMIDRFGLLELFSRDVRREQNWGHDLIEPKQYVQLLEDFMMLCIHLATDMSFINKHCQERITRRHIVQYLGLQNMTYSEILKKLPERSIAMSFAPLLQEMAEFKQPTETVQGQYSLKPEYIKDVDPYWHHFSRNEQRKAIDRILEQRKKDGDEDEVIKPLSLEQPDHSGPWYNVQHWLGTPVAYEIIHYAMAHCHTIAEPEFYPGQRFVCEDDKTPPFDLVLDLTLHLCMLAIAFDARSFALASFHKNNISNALSTFQQLWRMQMSEHYKPWLPRITFIVEAIATNVPVEYMADYRKERAEAAAAEAAKAPKPDARKAAADRQKAIMANFAKQQKDFAAALDFDDADDEDDEMDEAEEEQEEMYGQCIVCQEDVTPSNTGGLLALMQPCRVMRDAVPERDWFEESLLAPSSLDHATRYHRFGMGTTGEPLNTDAYPARSHRFGAYISGCSHLMHEQCMANYFDATRYRHTQQVQRHHPENAVRSEYLCPLCKSLGNMLIPLDKPLVQLRSHFTKDGKVPSLKEKMRDVSSEGLLKVRDSSKIWDHHVDTGELMPWFSDCIFHAASGKDQPYRREMRLSARMIERYRQLVRPLSDQSQIIRQKKAHMYLPNDIVNYTISAIEVSYRGLAMPTTALSVAEQVSESQIRLVSRLIGSLQLELDLFFGKRYDRTALRVGIFARLLPDWYRASTLPTPLVCRNPLTLVIETAAIAPDLLHSVIHMGFFAEITRLMLGSCMWIKRCMGGKARPSPRSSPPADPHLAQALAVWRGVKQIILSALRQNAGPFTEAEPTLALVSDDEMAKIMYSHTLPYLRRCAIIFYACTGRYPAPDALEDAPGGVEGMCEYVRLLKLLALPNPVEALNAPNSTEGPMVGRWLSQWVVQGRMIPNLEYPGVYELARLPRRWEDVVIKYTETRCDVCGLVPANPALCMICGKYVCMAGDCCAEGEQGECNAHMRECGGAVGIFIDIRRWLILYLYAGSGSFATMPYLDTHGELDINMRRSHRQYMHMGRMEELRRQTWLQHMIPHMTARKLELTSDGGGWVSL